ncbi:MAG: hypothetical protein HKM24_01705, partial [Gammaproteobacteria bacterium]|nr:hypothetical protein [Gammaproteobacteria bacterium]
MRYQVIFVTSLLLMSACSTLSIDHQTISDNSTPAPTLAVECTAANVNFDRSNCIITIEVAHDGRTLRSKALPIHANSLQIMPILPNEHLGLGDMTNRNIKAWSVGQEEQSVDVAVEIAMLSDTPMLIVHQRYGFEHV